MKGLDKRNVQAARGKSDAALAVRDFERRVQELMNQGHTKQAALMLAGQSLWLEAKGR